MIYKKEYYPTLNILRIIAAIFIVILHVDANSSFGISNPIYISLVSKFGHFTFLFMIISSFSMSCAYFDRIKDGTISMERFYTRRFNKIWPFFACIVIMELVYTHNLSAFFESFADFTMAFALLPNPDLSIVGVGWTLGVIFLFYMLFPYFVFLFSNMRRAWLTFGISILYNIICVYYFFNSNFVSASFWPKRNFLYCFMFFAAGGIIYLYRNYLKNMKNNVKLFVIFLDVFFAVLFFGDFCNKEIAKGLIYLCFFSCIVITAIQFDLKFAYNKFFCFLNGITMEIYLSHMAVFRLVQLMNISALFGDMKGVACFVTNILVILLSILFSWGLKTIITICSRRFSK